MLRHFLLLIIKNDGTVVDRINSIATIDFSKATAANIKDLVGNGFYSTCCTFLKLMKQLQLLVVKELW